MWLRLWPVDCVSLHWFVAIIAYPRWACTQLAQRLEDARVAADVKDADAPVNVVHADDSDGADGADGTGRLEAGDNKRTYGKPHEPASPRKRKGWQPTQTACARARLWRRPSQADSDP